MAISNSLASNESIRTHVCTVYTGGECRALQFRLNRHSPFRGSRERRFPSLRTDEAYICV